MVTIVQQPNENEQRRRKQTIERAKANHVLSRQLQMRLQYARIKVEHGWQRQTLNEVENLYFTRKNPKQTKGHLTAPPVVTFPSPPIVDQYTAATVVAEGAMEEGVSANMDVEAGGTGVAGELESQSESNANGQDGVVGEGQMAPTVSPPLMMANPPLSLQTDSPEGGQVQLATTQEISPPPVLTFSYQSSPQPPPPLSQSHSTYYPQAQYQYIHPQQHQQPSLDYYPSQTSNQQPLLHLGQLSQPFTQFTDMLASSGSGSNPWPKSGTTLPSSHQQPPPSMNAFSNSSSLTYDSFWSGFRSGSVTPAPLQSTGKIPGSIEQNQTATGGGMI